MKIYEFIYGDAYVNNTENIILLIENIKHNYFFYGIYIVRRIV
jgi:hypothetical protein